MSTGVYQTSKKDGSLYYRASLTYHAKHISLGSSSDAAIAHAIYREAMDILSSPAITPENYTSRIRHLSFEKAISLLNFRDHGMYIKTPIYLQKGFFSYYLEADYDLKFDNDDLFYYSSHKIMRRGNHLFVNDYGMQYNIAQRYGIKNYGVAGRDYVFVNGIRPITAMPISASSTPITASPRPRKRANASLLPGSTSMVMSSLENIQRRSRLPSPTTRRSTTPEITASRKILSRTISQTCLPREYADVYSALKLSQTYLDYIDSFVI